MRPDRGGGGPQGGRYGAGPSRGLPRVVILEQGGSAQVKVLELPTGTAPGTCFTHSGTTWRVTGTRTHERVFIARPDRA